MPSAIIARIDIDAYNLSLEVNYLNSLQKIPESYDEFGQGYWKNISLYNSTGEPGDTLYQIASACRPTPHLASCPEINRLILDNFRLDNLKMVRARSLIDGMVIPHRDFVELDNLDRYLRLFVPLENNREAFHSDESGVFQMKAGEVWFLDAGINHAAINFSCKSRMFLCLDFVISVDAEQASVLLQTAKTLLPCERSNIRRQALTPKDIEETIHAAAKIISRRTLKDLIFALSKYHFTYDIPILACYDWIIDAALLAGDRDTAEKARSLKRYLVEHRHLNERFTING
jgi:hypothetical protein